MLASLPMLSLLATPGPPLAFPPKPNFCVLFSALLPLVLECSVEFSLLLVTAVAVTVTPLVYYCPMADCLTSGLM